MKNFFKLVVLLVITSSVMVMMNYCSKTKEEVITNENQTGYETLIEKSKVMQEHILAFKAKMEYYRDNPGLKSGGELYFADSAILEIESLINYDSCKTNPTCNKKSFVTSEIIIPLDDL